MRKKLLRQVERVRKGQATPAEQRALFGKLIELKPEELQQVVGGIDDPHGFFDQNDLPKP